MKELYAIEIPPELTWRNKEEENLLGGKMKKRKIDIPLELYTDNVRKIIERSVYNPNLVPTYLSSLLCDPEITEKDLKTALKLLEKAGIEVVKQRLIRSELKARKEKVTPEPFPEDLRKEWEDMRKAAAKRKIK